MNKPVFHTDSGQAIAAHLMSMALVAGIDTPVLINNYGRPVTPAQYLADQEALKKRAEAAKATIEKNRIKQERKAALRLKHRKENQ